MNEKSDFSSFVYPSLVSEPTDLWLSTSFIKVSPDKIKLVRVFWVGSVGTPSLSSFSWETRNPETKLLKNWGPLKCYIYVHAKGSFRFWNECTNESKSVHNAHRSASMRLEVLPLEALLHASKYHRTSKYTFAKSQLLFEPVDDMNISWAHGIQCTSTV